MSKLSQYEALVAVVDSGSLSVAADRLNRTPSAISKQIAGLEADLGVRLFNRSAKKLVATELGMQFYRSSLAILRQVEEAEQRIVLNSQAVSGDINISLSKSLIGSRLTTYLNEFADQYPRTRFILKSSESVASFNDSDLDFAFRLGKVADSTRLVAKELEVATPVFYATPTYLERHGTPGELADLHSHRLALPPLENLSTELRAWLKSRRFLFNNASHHIVDDVNTVQALVLAHGCIGLNLENSLLKPIENKVVTKLLPNFSLPSKPLYLVYRKVNYPSAQIDAFKQFIVDKYR